MKSNWMEKYIARKLRKAEEPIDTEQLWNDIEPQLEKNRRRPIAPLFLLLTILGTSIIALWWSSNDIVPNYSSMSTQSELSQKEKGTKPKLIPAESSKRIMDNRMAAEEHRLALYLDDENAGADNPDEEFQAFESIEEWNPRRVSQERSTAPLSSLASPNLNELNIGYSSAKSIQEHIECYATKGKSLIQEQLEDLPHPDYSFLDEQSNSFLTVDLLQSDNAMKHSIGFVQLQGAIGAFDVNSYSPMLPSGEAVKWSDGVVQSYGLLVGREIHPRLRFSTGLQWTRWSQRMNYTSEKVVLGNQSNQLLAARLFLDGSRTEEYGTVLQSQTIRTYYETMLELRAVEFPINLQIELLQKNRWEFSAVLSGIISWQQVLSGYFFPSAAQGGQDSDLIVREFNSNERSIHWAAGLGVGYRLNSKYTLLCNPIWRSGEIDINLEENIGYAQDGGALAIQVGLRRQL